MNKQKKKMNENIPRTIILQILKIKLTIIRYLRDLIFHRNKQGHNSYHKQLYAKIMDKLGKMGKFLGTHNLPRLTYGIRYLNRHTV